MECFIFDLGARELCGFSLQVDSKWRRFDNFSLIRAVLNLLAILPILHHAFPVATMPHNQANYHGLLTQMSQG